MNGETLLPDIARFARAMIASRDLDPLYPVLAAVEDRVCETEEERLWLTALYLAYYHMSSALAAYRLMPSPDAPLPDALGRFPTGIERRGLRGGKVVAHLDHLAALAVAAGGLRRFVAAPGWYDPAQPVRNYLRFWDVAQQPWGNGRWAAFKWAELLREVNGLAFSAPDMRMAECTGPKECLAVLAGLRAADPVAAYDRAGEDLRDRLREREGLDLSWEELETVLCNFGSLLKGRYYVGHDIDELQERLDAPFLDPADRDLLFTARREALPAAYLGELGGWHGVDADRKRVYASTGMIVTREAA